MTVPRVKITVERKVDVRDLWGDNHPATVDDFPPVCPFYNVGDEFIIDQVKLPEGFCVSAFSDLYRYIFALRAGSNFSWMKRTKDACSWPAPSRPNIPSPYTTCRRPKEKPSI